MIIKFFSNKHLSRNKLQLYIIYAYAISRMLHHPFLYKRVHKQHHEWTAPIGIAALYSHPVEQLSVNSFQVIQASESDWYYQYFECVRHLYVKNDKIKDPFNNN